MIVRKTSIFPSHQRGSMEMTIINLGTRIVNNYLISSKAGWILIDNGYTGAFRAF